MSTGQDLAWWQKPLVFLKLWRPAHRTLHHEMKELERPAMPPVTGAHGNTVDLRARRSRVPQRGDG